MKPQEAPAAKANYDGFCNGTMTTSQERSPRWWREIAGENNQELMKS
jgi:hypothetical protein